MTEVGIWHSLSQIKTNLYSLDLAGHFERRISFGYDADMAAIRAEFNGDLLRVTVPRRWMFGPALMMPRSMGGTGGGSATRPTVENPNDMS
jgi:hypothetical protein